MVSRRGGFVGTHGENLLVYVVMYNYFLDWFFFLLGLPL